MQNPTRLIVTTFVELLCALFCTSENVVNLLLLNHWLNGDCFDALLLVLFKGL